jgi:hypothetical protein
MPTYGPFCVHAILVMPSGQVLGVSGLSEVSYGSWLCENAFAVRKMASAMAAARRGDHFGGVLIFSSGDALKVFSGRSKPPLGRGEPLKEAVTIAVMPPSAA